MKLNQRQRILAVTLAIFLVLARPVLPAESIGDYLAGDWYVTEVIIFQRPATIDSTTAEQLLVSNPPAFPISMRSLYPDSDSLGTDYPLDELMLLALEPEFTITEIPTSFIVPLPIPIPAISPTVVVVPDSILQPIGNESFAGDPSESSTEIVEVAESAETDPTGMPPPVITPTLTNPMGMPPPVITPTFAPNELLDFLIALGHFEDSLNLASYRWLPEQDHTLQRTAMILAGRVGSHVLLHGRWVQPVPARDSPQPLYIRAGARFSNTQQLEGTLNVTLGRYLHFRASLIYQEPGFGLPPLSVPYPVNAGVSSRLPTLPEALPNGAPGFVLMEQSRRMRSEEVHYLDHPKLGIIVRIDPVAIPEELRLLFKDLKESRE